MNALEAVNPSDIKALVVYPLSKDYKEALEKKIKEKIHFVSIRELSKEGIPSFIINLWRIRCRRLLLPIEDLNAKSVISLLKIISFFTRAHRIEIVEPDLSQVSLRRSQSFFSIIDVLWTTLKILWDTVFCYIQILALSYFGRFLQDIENKNKKSILYIKSNLWFSIKAGGSVGHITGVIQGLKNAAYKVDFASAETLPFLKKYIRKTIDLPLPKKFGLPYECNNYAFDRMITKRILKEARHEDYAFIYQRLSICNFTGPLLAKKLRLPLIIEYNGSEVWVSKHWGKKLFFPEVAQSAEDLCLKAAAYIVTISDVLKDELIERGVDPQKIITYPNCVDAEVYSSERFSKDTLSHLRTSLKLSDETYIATFVGTFGQWHGIDVLAKAIAKLHQHDRSWLEEQKLHFVLIGDGLGMPEVRKILDTIQGDVHVTLTGLIPQDETPPYLAMSDLLLSPHKPNVDGTRFFGSPTKLFEYMAMGKPIIASNLEQIGDVLAPGIEKSRWTDDLKITDETSLLTTPGDVDALVEAIKYAVTHRDKIKKLGENARKKVLCHYTWDHHVGKILERII